MTTDEHYSKTVMIDEELDFARISDRLIDEMEILKPFGTDNPEPLFMAQDVSVSYSRIIGANHRKMVLKQRNDKRTFMAIQFHIDPTESPPEYFEKIAFRLRWNRWQQRKDAQLLIEETQG